jgi:transposase
MANKPIVMNKLRRVLQLYHQGKSKLFISKYLDLSRNTVNKYITQCLLQDKPIEEVLELSDLDLEKLFIEKPPPDPTQKLKDLYSFFPYAEKMLKKTGVTKGMLWQEYIALHPDGYKSSMFCERFNRWSKRTSPVMHINHKAGDKVYVDYAGKTLEVVDKESGEVTEVQFFIAVLGASQYTYAEATPSQGKEDFITSVENALQYYGGVPAAIVPDNLKSAVTKSNRYEPTLNETFLDFAQHYNTTVLPARVYKPRDKSLVEGAVKILYTRIYTILRKNTYYSLKELNAAIWEALEAHNQTNFTGRSHSRSDVFNEMERQELANLPLRRYEIKHQAHATVMQNGHICLGIDKHYYSVPYQYIRKKIKLLYTSQQVEVFYKYNRIAVHQRNKTRYNYTTIPEHMASTHKYMTDWSPQRFINWAESVGEPVKRLIIRILEKRQHPEQAYKSCMGILALEKKVGKQRLINACKRAHEYHIYNYKIVLSILEKNLDKDESEQEKNEKPPDHQNIRGNEYYQ